MRLSVLAITSKLGSWEVTHVNNFIILRTLYRFRSVKRAYWYELDIYDWRFVPISDYLVNVKLTLKSPHITKIEKQYKDGCNEYLN